MPRRGEVRASALQAAISREMRRIDGRQVRGADRCDEIGNNALMENATGQSSCFQCLEVEVDRGGLESVTYAKRTHCLISQQQELKNATVKSSRRENQSRLMAVPLGEVGKDCQVMGTPPPPYLLESLG